MAGEARVDGGQGFRRYPSFCASRPGNSAAGVITAKYNRLFSGFTRELQSGINSDILDHLHDREMEDWLRFGKVRQSYEKWLRGTDGVIQAEERKKELAKKRKRKK